MPKTNENPRYNIISMRISEEERKHLDLLVEKTHMSISHIMREAIRSFSAIHEQEKPDPTSV